MDYETYNFYKYGCKILRYFILEGMGAGRGREYGSPITNIYVIKLIIARHTASIIVLRFNKLKS